jgi:hypothetical protein
MSDLPEGAWKKSVYDAVKSVGSKISVADLIIARCNPWSADLAPVIGFADPTCASCGGFMRMKPPITFECYNTHGPLTPTAQLRDPAVLVEALERLSVLGNAPYPGTSEGNMIAREALAEWKGGLNE